MDTLRRCQKTPKGGEAKVSPVWPEDEDRTLAESPADLRSPVDVPVRAKEKRIPGLAAVIVGERVEHFINLRFGWPRQHYASDHGGRREEPNTTSRAARRHFSAGPSQSPETVGMSISVPPSSPPRATAAQSTRCNPRVALAGTGPEPSAQTALHLVPRCVHNHVLVSTNDAVGISRHKSAVLCRRALELALEGQPARDQSPQAVAEAQRSGIRPAALVSAAPHPCSAGCAGLE